jgi:hypothetical protein
VKNGQDDVETLAAAIKERWRDRLAAWAVKELRRQGCTCGRTARFTRSRARGWPRSRGITPMPRYRVTSNGPWQIAVYDAAGREHRLLPGDSRILDSVPQRARNVDVPEGESTECRYWVEVVRE